MLCSVREERHFNDGISPAGTLAWLGFGRVRPNRWFSRRSITESTHWMVLRRPVELARLSGAEMTGPTFCTTASERVYITISSGKDALGGSQGAVGDRRAAKCGANAAGAGGL